MAPSYTPNKIPGMALPSSLLKYEEPQQLQDIMHQQALQRAQQLQTQQAEIATQQKQQAFDRQNQVREDIQSRFSDGGDGDLDNALGIIQASALEAGDYETALNVEKSRRGRKQEVGPADPLLVKEYEGLLGRPLPPGITENQLNKLTYAEAVAGKRVDSMQDIAERRANGELIRPLTASQEDEITGLSEVEGLSANILNKWGPGLEANRGVRWAEAKINPNSEVSRMDNELTQLVFALAAAKNGKRISDADFTYMAPLVKIQPLDTVETVYDKVARVVEFAKLRKLHVFDTFRKSNRNISNFETPRNPDDLANSLVGQQDTATAADEQAYKEQYKAKMRASRR